MIYIHLRLSKRRWCLILASPEGHGLIDRRLYLPKDWAEDGERPKKTHICDELAVATKPKIGIATAEAALTDDCCAIASGCGSSLFVGSGRFGSRLQQGNAGHAGKARRAPARAQRRAAFNRGQLSVTCGPRGRRRRQGERLVSPDGRQRKDPGSTAGLASVSCVGRRRPGTIGG
jgi:hypothetical protein